MIGTIRIYRVIRVSSARKSLIGFLGFFLLLLLLLLLHHHLLVLLFELKDIGAPVIYNGRIQWDHYSAERGAGAFELFSAEKQLTGGP